MPFRRSAMLRNRSRSPMNRSEGCPDQKVVPSSRAHRHVSACASAAVLAPAGCRARQGETEVGERVGDRDGTVGVAVRVTRPSRSRERSVWVSIFWLTPASRRSSASSSGWHEIGKGRLRHPWSVRNTKPAS
jgi:hypothetical protein